MSLATASCDLWQNEQRRISSDPVRFFNRPPSTYSYSLLATSGKRQEVEHPLVTALLWPSSLLRTRPQRVTEGRSYSLASLIDDIVNDSVFFGLLGVHNKVAFHVLFDFIQLLATMLRQQLICNLTHTENLARMDVDISCLAGQASHRGLMNQDSRIGKRQPLLILPCREQ